jgi:hypothetical protein
MQGATLSVTGTVLITNVQKGNSDDWVTAELAEAPASKESGKGQSWELLPIRARIRVPSGAGAPQEGSLLEIRSAALSRSFGEYEGKKTPFWNVAIFSWRELSVASASQRGTAPGSTPTTVASKPTVKRPVMDDKKEAWEEDVPF